MEGAARALIAGPETGSQRLERARLAVLLAPDIPMLRMALARAQLGEGEYLRAVSSALDGLRAIPRNLEATVWLAGSLLAMFAGVLVAGPLAFIVWIGVGAFRHAAHAGACVWRCHSADAGCIRRADCQHRRR